MRYVSRAERTLAVILMFPLGSVGLPSFAGSAPGLISGKILRTGSGNPVAGAVVKAALRPEARIFESPKTDGRGNYSLSGLPSGTYDVAVEADGGVYVVGGTVSLKPGETRGLSLSVRPLARGDSKVGSTPDEQPPPEPPPPPPPEPPPPPPPEPPPPEPPPPESPPPETPPPEPPKEAPTEPPKEEKPEKPAPKKAKFWRTPWGGAAIIVGTAVIVGALASSSDKDKSASASPSSD